MTGGESEKNTNQTTNSRISSESCYLWPVVMVTEGRVDGEVGEVLPDGLGHVPDHLDHRVCGELTCRDVRRTVSVRHRRDV